MIISHLGQSFVLFCFVLLQQDKHPFSQQNKHQQCLIKTGPFSQSQLEMSPAEELRTAPSVSGFKNPKTPVRHFCTSCFQWIYPFSKNQGPVSVSPISWLVLERSKPCEPQAHVGDQGRYSASSLDYGSPVARTAKNLPAVQEARVPSLGWEDSLAVATHPSLLAWRIPRTEEPGGLQSTGSQRVGHD